MLTVSWTAVPGAASYTVQWKSGSEQYAETRQQSVTTPSATLTRLTNGATYTVRVRASNAQGDSDWSPGSDRDHAGAAPGAARATEHLVPRRRDAGADLERGTGRRQLHRAVEVRSERYSEARQRTVPNPPFALDHLTYGITYTMRVRASNRQRPQ